jgi:peptidoglycan hydrolase-like protein with peptidoglycan-binding domain
MTMSKPNRSGDFVRDDRDARFATPGSLPIRVAEAALRNPVTTGGVLISSVMVLVTVANAVANQPARHPSPWFATRTAVESHARPAAARGVAAPAPASPAVPSELPTVLPRPKPVSEVEDLLVRDLQVALVERGFYTGPVDGVAGPATTEAIRACERRLGAPPTGEASELLLAALRAAPSVVASPALPPVRANAPATKSAARQAAPPVAPEARASAPTPSMRVAAADAVAYPAASLEMSQYAEVDTPVFTGSIRRAAREPLAPGGDEKLQKLQRALIASGYGPLKADGHWDDRSTSAVRRYEADRGWTVTGKPSDRLVWDLMAKTARTRR